MFSTKILPPPPPPPLPLPTFGKCLPLDGLCGWLLNIRLDQQDPKTNLPFMISFDMEKPFNKSGPLVTPETNVNSFNVTSNKCESETKYFYFT